MKRTRQAFTIFAALAISAAALWEAARNAPEDAGLPAPFRRALDWNGNLWAKLSGPGRLNQGKAPQPGKKPRFNGDIGLKSELDLSNWRLEVAVDREGAPTRVVRQITMAEILSLPKTSASSQFFCIEGWSDMLSYAGVRFSDFLKAFGLEQNIAYVGLETPDHEYYVSIDMASMLHSQTVLAYELNGAPLDSPNGAPLRLVIPIKYGIKSLKRIGRITLSDHRLKDYWYERGYDWFAGL